MHVKKSFSILLATLLAAALTGCGGASPSASEPPASAEGSPDAAFSEGDTKIALDGGSASIKGSGAEAAGSIVTITEAGVYVVSGTLENGQIVVDCKKSETVHLVLNGASITNQTGAAVYAAKCKELIVTLADGTENTLADGGAAFRYADEGEKEPNAALFAKNDLTINGTGALKVNAGFKNGIGTKDHLIIMSGTITVNAAGHAVSGKDSVSVLGGALDLSSGGDGVRSDGALSVSGGTVNILKSQEGLEGFSVEITGGELSIVSQNDGINASGGGDEKENAGDASQGSGHFIRISGGVVRLTAGGDGVDSNGSIDISGGELYAFIASTPDNGAFDCDETATVTGGILVYGGTGAGDLPDKASKQGYVSLEPGLAAGTEISLKKGGTALLSCTLPVACKYLVVSAPDVVPGESYELFCDNALFSAVTASAGG